MCRYCNEYPSSWAGQSELFRECRACMSTHIYYYYQQVLRTYDQMKIDSYAPEGADNTNYVHALKIYKASKEIYEVSASLLERGMELAGRRREEDVFDEDFWESQW